MTSTIAEGKKSRIAKAMTLSLLLVASSFLFVIGNQQQSFAVTGHSFGVTNTIAVGDNPRGFAFNPTNNYFYVVNSNSDDVSVIDGTTVIDTIAVGDNPTSITYNPTDNKLYVTNFSSDTLSIIDGTTVIDTLTGFVSPRYAAFNPTNNKLYVSNFGGNSVSVMDGNNVIDTIPVGESAHYIAFNPSNNKMYVTNQGSGDVSVIDDTIVTATILVGGQPDGVTFNPSNGKMYVANGGSNTVSVIDDTTVVHTIPVGNEPVGVAFNPSNGKIFVANLNSQTVSVIDDITVIDTVTGVPSAHDIAFNTANNKLYVSNFADPGSVSIIDVIFLQIDWTKTQVWNNNVLEVRANMNAIIPEDGLHGAFGYAWMTDGLNNVLIVVTHLGMDDSSHEEPVSGFHTHVVDLMAPTASCASFDAEVDLIGSAANAAFDSDYIFFITNKRVEVHSVPAADLGDAGIESFATFTVTPVTDPDLHLCVAIVDTV